MSFPLSKKLMMFAGEPAYWCPGCRCLHRVPITGSSHPRWDWNGSVVAPSFSPSVLVRGVRDDLTDEEAALYDQIAVGPAGVRAAMADPRFALVCHAFVTAGQIRFLGDSTHALAGQTVTLPDLPAHLVDAGTLQEKDLS